MQHAALCVSLSWSGAGGGRAGTSGAGDTTRKEEVDLAYKELVRSGWPGFFGADGAAAQVCTGSSSYVQRGHPPQWPPPPPPPTILVCYETQQPASCATIMQDPPAEKEEPSQRVRSRRGGRQPGRGRRLVKGPPADSKPREVMHIGFEYESPQVQNLVLPLVIAVPEPCML